MRSFRRGLCVALALAGAGLSSAWAQERPPGASVDELLAIARERNPELAAMRHEAEAATERIYPAGALPDPMFRVELQDITNREREGSLNLLPSRVGSTKYTVFQSLPLGGKRELRRGIAEAEAVRAENLTAATWTELAARVKGAFAEYYLADRSLRLAREVIDLMSGIEQVAHSRYASGLVPQQDVVRAQVELTNLRGELLTLEREHHHHRAQLNRLLKRPAGAALADPHALRPLPAAALDFVRLEGRLRQANPQLAAQDAQIRAAGHSQQLAETSYVPDLTVGVSPIQSRNRVAEWELMFEVNIPLQRESRRSQVREAVAMASAARARKDAAETQLLSELSEALAALEAGRRLEALSASSLLPQANLAFEAALAGYETGKVDFATLLDAQRQIRKAKADIFKAQAEQQMRLAEIERIVGEDL